MRRALLAVLSATHAMVVLKALSYLRCCKVHILKYRKYINRLLLFSVFNVVECQWLSENCTGKIEQKKCVCFRCS